MEVNRLIILAMEIFKTLNNLNPKYVKERFHKTSFLTHRPLNIQVNSCNTSKYGTKSLTSLGPHIWNSLPEEIKAETNYSSFKEYINQWFVLKCKCNLCSYQNGKNE